MVIAVGIDGSVTVIERVRQARYNTLRFMDRYWRLPNNFDLSAEDTRSLNVDTVAFTANRIPRGYTIKMSELPYDVRSEIGEYSKDGITVDLGWVANYILELEFAGIKL